MVNPQELYEDTIRTGIFYAQVEPRIEMFRHLHLDVRSQEEVRAVASTVLNFMEDRVGTINIRPFQASHAITTRRINGRLPEEYCDISPGSAPDIVPNSLRPVLDELLSRDWENRLVERGYRFESSDGLVYSVCAREDYPKVFDPVILVVKEPLIKDATAPTERERKAQSAFEDLEQYLIGGFGLLMKRFDPQYN